MRIFRKNLLYLYFTLIFIFIFNLNAYCEMINCQHCNKNIDSSNKFCPYCLNELKIPAIKNNNLTNEKNEFQNIPQPNSKQTKNNQMQNSFSEQDVLNFLDSIIIKNFHNKHTDKKLTISNIKKDQTKENTFKVIGTLVSFDKMPMNSVGKFLEILEENNAINKVNLNNASKVNINDPTKVNFTITLSLNPNDKQLINIRKKQQPFEFTFIIPPFKSESVNVKIIKKNADSENILYNMNNKPGDKVTLSLIQEPNMKIIVKIDEKIVYEKNY